jgi:hypothetical protein
MPWEARYLAAERLVDSSYAGHVTPDEFRTAISAAVELARRNGTDRYLTDLSGMVDGHSLVDISEAVGAFEAMGLPHSLREALIVPPAAASSDRARFYETACQNRGWNVRIFGDRATALAWLTEP